MHEIRIAEDLARIVLETAGNENLTVVSAVNISFGQMVQIVPEIFKFAFTEAVRDTIAAAAEINIEVLSVRLKCKTCGAAFNMGDEYFTCNNCGSSEIEILQGKELFIKSIEGE